MGAPLTARDVAGEVRQTALSEAVRLHGAHVPQYNRDGQLDHRSPYKDLSGIAGVDGLPDWSRVPKHRTRTELLAARRAERHLDLTCDIDGDGAVGPADHFIAKQFSREGTNRLNTGDRNNAAQALESGWLDTYSFGHDASGIQRAQAFKQIGGQIAAQEEAFGDHPPHWNASVEPEHKSFTELALHRKAATINHNRSLADAWEQQHPIWALEPPFSAEGAVVEPAFATLTQRNDAVRRSAREQVGMDGANSVVNPDRDHQHIGLGYRPSPVAATRTEMLGQRRVQNLKELAETHLLGEQDYVPPNCRASVKQALEYDRQRTDPNCVMTHTKLMAQRRQERIEYNMSRLSIQPKATQSRGMFSADTAPWWTLRDHMEEPPVCLLKELQSPRAGAELKVTEISHHTRAVAQPSVLPPSLANKAHVDGYVPPSPRTLRTWAQEFVRPPLAHHEKRVFDDVKQAPPLMSDSSALNNYSSFETIRNAGQQEFESNTREDEDRLAAWQRYMRQGPAREAAAKAPSLSTQSRQLIAGAATSSGVPASTKLIAEPSGEDPPMTVRLDRVAESSGSPRVEKDRRRLPGEGGSSSAVGGRDHDSGMVVRSSGFQWLQGKLVPDHDAVSRSNSTQSSPVSPAVQRQRLRQRASAGAV